MSPEEATSIEECRAAIEAIRHAADALTQKQYRVFHEEIRARYKAAGIPEELGTLPLWISGLRIHAQALAFAHTTAPGCTHGDHVVCPVCRPDLILGGYRSPVKAAQLRETIKIMADCKQKADAKAAKIKVGINTAGRKEWCEGWDDKPEPVAQTRPCFRCGKPGTSYYCAECAESERRSALEAGYRREAQKPTCPRCHGPDDHVPGGIWCRA